MICRRWLIALLLLAAPLAAQSIPDRDVRESAERILSDPAFQNFDRFPKGNETPDPAPASPSSNASSEKSPESSEQKPSESASPSNWWDRLRQRGQKADGKAKSSTTSSQPSSQSSEPGSSSQSSDGTPGKPASGKDSATSSPQRQPAPVRPQSEAGIRTPPAQRGNDGVTRPVRFAPKVRTPPPKGPEWNINLDWMSGFGTVLGSVLHVLAYAVVIGVCVLIVMLVARAVAEHRRNLIPRGQTALSAATPLAHDRSPGETEADVFLREALRLADQGEYRPALAQLVLGAMSTIERRQWIRYRRGLTLNDYLRSVRSRPEQLSGLRSVVDSYEPVEFGRRSATEPVFATALAGYRQAFSSLDVAPQG